MSEKAQKKNPDLAAFDYHLFASMAHALAFSNFEEVGNRLTEWFVAKDKLVFWHGIHKLPERYANCVEGDGQYFE